MSTTSRTAASAISLLRSLSTDEIRLRLIELDRESQALRTLLRAMVRLKPDQVFQFMCQPGGTLPHAAASIGRPIRTKVRQEAANA